MQPLEEEGGQVLKFLGDGLLATFALEEGRREAEVCAAALRAARQAVSRVEQLMLPWRTIGEIPSPLDVVLHLGA